MDVVFEYESNSNISILYDNNIFTFGKDSGTSNITIDFLKNSNSDVPSNWLFTNSAMPNFLFMFDIVGVPK